MAGTSARMVMSPHPAAGACLGSREAGAATRGGAGGHLGKRRTSISNVLLPDALGCPLHRRGTYAADRRRQIGRYLPEALTNASRKLRGGPSETCLEDQGVEKSRQDDPGWAVWGLESRNSSASLSTDLLSGDTIGLRPIGSEGSALAGRPGGAAAHVRA